MNRVTVSPAPLRLFNKDMLEKLRLQIFGKKNITNAQIVRRVFRAYGFTEMWTNLNKNDRTVKIGSVMDNAKYQTHLQAWGTSVQLLQLAGVDILKVNNRTCINPTLFSKMREGKATCWVSILIHVPFDTK